MPKLSLYFLLLISYVVMKFGDYVFGGKFLNGLNNEGVRFFVDQHEKHYLIIVSKDRACILQELQLLFFLTFFEVLLYCLHKAGRQNVRDALIKWIFAFNFLDPKLFLDKGI